MNNLSPIETLSSLEISQASTISFEEVATDFPFPAINIAPEVTDQLVSGGIAIGAIWAVSGLLKQFRLLIEAIDRADQ